MKKENFQPINEKYRIVPSSEKGCVQVAYSFECNEEIVTRFFVYKLVNGKNNFYYIAKTRAQVAEEKKNGKLERYTKNYVYDVKTSNAKKIGLFVVCPLLIVGAVFGSVFLARHFMSSEWKSINNETAAKICKDMAVTQNFDFKDIESADYNGQEMLSMIFDHDCEMQYVTSYVTNYRGPFASNDIVTQNDTTVDFSFKDNGIYLRSAKNTVTSANPAKGNYYYCIYQNKEDKEGLFEYRRTEKQEKSGAVPSLRNEVECDYETALKKYIEQYAFYDNPDEFANKYVINADLFYGHMIKTPTHLLQANANKVSSIAKLLSPMYISYGISNDEENYYKALDRIEPTADVKKCEFYQTNDNAFRSVADVRMQWLFEDNSTTPINYHVDAEFKKGVCVRCDYRIDFTIDHIDYYIEWKSSVKFDNPIQKVSGWEEWPVEEPEDSKTL